MNGRTLLVGIGSPHGDDRVGWLVAQEVAARSSRGLEVRPASHPAELLDWLDNVERLIICDAIDCHWPAGDWRTWIWPNSEIMAAHFWGSHDFSLVDALSLAEGLGRLPGRVELWVVSIDGAQPLTGVSRAVAQAVPRIAEEILGAVCDA